MIDREAMKMALDAMLSEYSTGGENKYSPWDVIEALRQALAQPEQGCAECGVKAIDGYALYCVACTEKFVGGYKENVPVHTSELLTQVSTGNHYSGNGTAGVQNETKPTGFFFQMPQKQAHDRACEVMRGLNNAELSQMTLLRAFAMGYRDANMRDKHD